MSRTIDYYFAPQSPWTFLGHERLLQLLRASRREVRVLPVDYGRIFPASGGLPLSKRAPQRQAYRLVELQRFADHLGVAMNVQPRHFPVDGNPAALLITAVAQHDGMDAALRLAGAVLAACWRKAVPACACCRWTTAASSPPRAGCRCPSARRSARPTGWWNWRAGPGTWACR